MSAWYVLSSMGIYSVTPGKSEWSVIQSNFENIKINFENKETKNITKKMLVNDLKYFGIKNNSIVVREGEGFNNISIVPVPVIQAESKAFKEKLKIEIINLDKDKYELIYNIENPNNKNLLGLRRYTEPFYITESCKINAFNIIRKSNNYSNAISATFFKKPNNYSINIKSKYNPQYHAGGPEGLLDGILGTENWRKGDWQGYQSQDFEAVVDLQEVKDIIEISARFLQDQRSWILMPTKVEYYISDDNVNFTNFGSVNNTLDPKIEENTILNFTSNETKNIKARYIKVIAKNFGKLPEWHQGFGGDAFIFVDEITIK
jgi:hypothetical protein